MRPAAESATKSIPLPGSIAMPTACAKSLLLVRGADLRVLAGTEVEEMHELRVTVGDVQTIASVGADGVWR
jgi:hypothetical protein